jgi:putative PEP-CTERM system TPR-repeat lipoprotein
LSQIEFNSGDLKAGIQNLNKAIKSSPDNAALHKQLARAYIANGETGLALQELKIFQRLSNDTEEAQRLTISAYLQAGEKNKAINVANTMLQQNPENASILALNGSLYAAVNNRQQARIYFNKALELEKNQPAATIGLARIETEENHLDRAEELYNGLIESSTGGAIPMLALANLAAQQKDNNGMLSWLERARNTSPSEIQSRIILANYYLRNNQPKNAEIYIKEAIKVSPENAELLALYGKALIAQKRYGDALLPLNRLVNNLPESTEARILLGETFLHQDMTDSAREHLQKALQIHNDLMPAMILMAEIEFKEGKYDKSMEYAKKLQKNQPRLYIGYMQEGDIWMARQDNNRALSAYSNAWNLAHSAELSKRLYFASRNSAGFQEAIKPLLSWLNDHPEDSSIRLFLATIYQGAKADVDAIREYEKVLLQTPDNVTALNNLAWLFSLTNNPKALDLAERAYRAAPENIGVLDTYGWVLVQQGQAEKGQHLIKQAMERLPDNLEIRYHYATALIKSGNEEEGRQMLEALLKQDKPFIGKNEAQQLLGKQKASR